MERDPLRFVRQTTPVLHALALMVLGLAAPIVLLGIDLVRTLIDDVIGGSTLANGSRPFLRLTLQMPERVSEEPMALFQGFLLEPEHYALAAIAGLMLVPALLALVHALVTFLASRIGTRALAPLRARVLGRILEARPAARDDAAAATALAGEGLARESGFLGSVLITPIQAVGLVVLTLAYALSVDWRLALAAMVGLAADALLQSVLLRARQKAVVVRRAEGLAIARSLSDLLRRLPALRAHGTSAYEWDRLQRDLVRQHRPVRTADRRLGLARAASGFTSGLPALAVLGAGAWLATGGRVMPGAVVASAAAAALATIAIRNLVQWRRSLEEARSFFGEIARVLGGLQSRERRGAAVALPSAGALVAHGVSAYDPASGVRLSNVDLSIAFPAHVAVVGDANAGPRIFAAVLGGQLDPSAGRLTFGGVDLTAADSADRAGKIAFAGGDTILMPGTLRQNLLYGCLDPEAPGIERRLIEAVKIADLEGFIHGRGLAGSFDPRREPKFAAALIETRRALRAALTAEGLDPCVDGFDVGRYNRHATIGENLLFGVPVGDTFREDNLAAHPFVRAVLEAAELTKPLTAMGLSIAASMVEIFADLPDGHPLFDRFSFFSSAERGLFEHLVEQPRERRRGPNFAREQEHLIGLALRYNENRHRLGLVGDELEQKLVAARADFAAMLPLSLQPAIEFYRPDRLCSAASIQDNLLFGRIAHDRAGAEEAVHRVARRVLTDRGLDEDVFRIGFASPVDPRGDDLTAGEIAAIDLVRCLVRRPGTIIVERALDGLPTHAADALVERLRRALVGRGLIIVMPALTARMDTPPFDAVLRFERGVLARQEDRRAPALPEPVPA